VKCPITYLSEFEPFLHQPLSPSTPETFISLDGCPGNDALIAASDTAVTNANPPLSLSAVTLLTNDNDIEGCVAKTKTFRFLHKIFGVTA
jgi:hypothetical protein